MIWTAPELLRMEEGQHGKGTQKGDVYSYGILLQEVAFRLEPYSRKMLQPKGGRAGSDRNDWLRRQRPFHLFFLEFIPVLIALKRLGVLLHSTGGVQVNCT